jgi:hypothetical protein
MTTRFATILLALLPVLALPAAAAASSGQLAIFQDDGRLLFHGPGVRDAALDELRALGADAIKLHVTWADVAPGGKSRPAGFQAHDPAAYREAAWERSDGAIRSAAARGLRVLVAVAPPAPGWATPVRGDSRGVWRPDAKEYGRFFRAVATRYDGAHADAAGNGLPRVDLWSIGNEPNHPNWAQPQGSRRGYAIAPHLYREQIRQAVAGLRLAGHGGDTVLFGELLPIGHSAYGPRRTIKPIAFLRELFCLDRRWRPYRGRDARIRNCQRFRRVTGVSGFAYHPYTRPDGPQGREPTSDDATIRSLSRITRALDRVAARGRLARRGLPLYVTEFGYQSDPPDPYQTRLSRIPAFLNEAEWISWRNRRVASWAQYGLVDDPLMASASGNGRYGLFQAALRFHDGRPKPGVYEAYRLPLFVRLLGPGAVEVWGAARPAAPGERVRVEQRLRGESRYRELGTFAIGNPRGYFRARFRVARASRRLFRFVYLDGGVERTSRTAKAVPR